MTYVKTNWTTETPINTTNLNKIEEGIANAVETDSEARVSNVVSKNLFHLWEQGGINSNNGSLTADAKRLRTIDYTKVTPNIDYYISIKDTNYCFVNIILFDENNNYGGQYYEDVSPAISGTASLKVKFPSGCYKIKAVLKRVDDTELTPNDISVIKPQLEKGSTETAYVSHINLEEAMQENIVYSTSEQRIGTWLGKPLYRKVVNVGNLPNATIKNIDTGITNATIVSMKGYATSGSGTTQIPIPFLDTGGLPTGVMMLIQNKGAELVITCGSDRSNWTAYVTLEYTKTTD